jgi:pectate lyase/fibronectin type 3 domain-containing protein
VLSLSLIFNLFVIQAGTSVAHANGSSSVVFEDDFAGATSANLFSKDYKALPDDASKPMYIRLGGTAAIDTDKSTLTLTGARVSVGAKSNTTTNATTTPGGVLDLSKEYKVTVNVASASGTGKFFIFVDNNSTSSGGSIHGNASKLYEAVGSTIQPGQISVVSSVGNADSFIGLRTESSATVTITSIKIEYVGGTDPETPPETPVPDAPTAAAEAGDTKVDVSWNAVSGAEQYTVKRSTNAEGPFDSNIATVTSDTYAFTDTAVTNSTTYYYVVTASANGKESAPSPIVSATPQAVPVDPPVEPSAPVYFDDFEDALTGTLFTAGYRAMPGNSSKALYQKTGGTVNIVDGAVSLEGGRFTIGMISDKEGIFDLSKKYNIIINVASVSGDTSKKFQVYVDNSSTSAGTSPHGTDSKVYEVAGKDLATGKHVIPSEVGSAASYLQLRTESNFNVAIESIAIVYDGDPDPTLPTAPGIPAGLWAIAGDEAVTLSWTLDKKAKGYYVKQAASENGPFTQVRNVVGNSVTVTGLTNGTTYYFVVEAYNDVGVSRDSAAVSARPIEGNAPAAPEGVRARAGNGEITITWSPSTGADSYTVKRLEGALWNDIATNIQGTSYTDTNLTNLQTYTYAVAAVNKRGEGAPSSTVSATPAEIVPPGDDEVVGFASLGNGGKGTTGGKGGEMITVTSGDQLDSIMLARKKIKDRTPLIIHVEGTLTFGDKMMDVKDTDNISIIGKGTDAKIDGFGLKVVRANNIIIQNLTFVNGRDDSIEVAECNNIWIDHNTFSKGYDGLLDVKEGSQFVTISWNHFKDHRKNSLVGHSDSNGATDVNLQVTYHHNFFDGTYSRNPRVRFGKVHVFNNYYLANGTTIDGGGYGIGAAADSQVYAEGNYFKDVNMPIIVGWADWKDSPIGNRPGYVYHTNNIFDNSGDPHMNESGVIYQPLDFYNYVVQDPALIPQIVVNGAGAAKVMPSNKPASPAGLVAVAGNEQVTLSWNAVAGAKDYRIMRSEVSGSGYTEIGVSAVPSFKDTNLANGKTYYYIVTAVNEHGESIPSQEKSASPQVVLPADVPKSLIARAASGKVQLSWAAVSGATGYNVKRSTTDGSEYQTIATVAANSYTDTDAADQTTYYYVVSSLKEELESANSAQVTATPMAPRPTDGLTLIVDDHFDTAVEGEIPVGYTVIETGGTVRIDKQAVFLKDTANASGEGNNVALQKMFDVQNDLVVVEFRFMQPTKGNSTKLIRLQPAEGGASPAVSLETVSGNITYRIDTEDVGDVYTPLITDYKAGQWYHVRVTADLIRQKADVMIDGVLLLEQAPFYSENETISMIESYTPNTGAISHYMDDVKVYGNGETAPPVLPGVPVDVSATAGNGEVSLSWSDAAHALSYLVKRGTAAGEYTESFAAATNSYRDTDVVNGVTYYYVVVAVNNAGAGSPSEPVEATPILTDSEKMVLALARINADPAGSTVEDLTAAGVMGVDAEKLELYRAKLASVKGLKGADLTMSDIQVQIAAANTGNYYTIDDVTLTGSGFLKASGKVVPISYNTEQAVVVFVLMNGTAPVTVVSQSVSLLESTSVSAGFNVTSTNSGYTVRIHVVSELSNDITNLGVPRADSKTGVMQQ